ncbi:glycosyltransferase family 2 protein [Salinimicrobium sp. TH3]|uniref:glycosyltransferase family 2 protein n=1 Tax=Salinimicrobium sp. TH3 TaxID=2997342 RepID=UPI0022755AA6|nr:glycosyltransferase family 2 protein [Salinimicrobium sp. TH3]MCY2687851.1 glycosyltransferase family 2 protein [Salinimicrobium sp. TH3]
MERKTSIIIPTYNRAHLIGATIDSVIKQTYNNWECIIVDDGSQDDTNTVLKQYCNREERISFYLRPANRPKGANSCRNFGLEKSKGEYIIWFDSDDLMSADHVERKVNAIEASDVDFVIGRTANFHKNLVLEPYYYEKKEYGIKASDFILLKIHWYTYDVLLKKDIADKIIWNERMKSWQDYNYFSKMLLKTEKGEYLDEILTFRRIHENSIQKQLTRSKKNFQEELLENRILTFYDIEKKIDPLTKKELVYGIMNLHYDLAKMGVFSRAREVIGIVGKELGITSVFLFKAAVCSAFYIEKGNYLLEISKKRNKGV